MMNRDDERNSQSYSSKARILKRSTLHTTWMYIILFETVSGKCMVPNLLRGTWNYGGAEYDGMTFTDRTLTLDETAGGQSVQLSCERSDYNPVDDVHMFAYRYEI